MGKKEPDLFDSSSDESDDEERADEILALRQRVHELELRCETLERELRVARGEEEDTVMLRGVRTRTRRDDKDEPLLFDNLRHQQSIYKSTVKRQNRGGRPRPLASERRAAKSCKQVATATLREEEPPPPPPPPIESPRESDQAIAAREDAAVKHWAASKADIMAMLTSLGEILPLDITTNNTILSQNEHPGARAVRRAYFQAVRHVHPDKCRDLSFSLRCRAQCVFSALTDALDAYDNYYTDER